MKVTVVGMLCCLLSLACTDKQKTFLPEAVPASAIAVIGGSEQDTTALTVEGIKPLPHRYKTGIRLFIRCPRIICGIEKICRNLIVSRNISFGQSVRCIGKM